MGTTFVWFMAFELSGRGLHLECRIPGYDVKGVKRQKAEETRDGEGCCASLSSTSLCPSGWTLSSVLNGRSLEIPSLRT